MTESVDRTYDLLQRVGEFLKKATAEELDLLAAGEARLAILPKGARLAKAAAPRAAKPAAPAVPADRVAAELGSIGDRAAATRYLADLKLSKDSLLLLAEELNVRVTKSLSMVKIRELIVEQKVGHRLTTNAILGSPTDSR